MAKATTKTAAKKAPAEKAAPDTPTSGHAAQTGMEAGLSPKEQRDAINRMFEKADEQGKADHIAETQAGLGIRGY